MQILAAVVQAWSRPPRMNSQLKAYAHIHMTASGEVESAAITSGSGYEAFDNSVLMAIYSASPLPLPTNPAVFVPDINLCFAPDPHECER